MKIYIAGPMRNIKDFNFPAFFDAERQLRSHGHEVYNPARADLDADAFDPTTDKAESMRHYMRRDLPAVLDCDIVVMLDGWQDSKGARLERRVALDCGIEVKSFHEFICGQAILEEVE